VKERVPDEIIASADQVVNIDLPAEDLQERLQAGKIYPNDRIQAALANFFTEKNLTRLREMTLSETASYLDRRQRESSSETSPGAIGQVMVAISSRGPDPGALLRKTARLAAQLNATWYAVYVRTPRESPTNIAAAAQRRVNDILEIAQKMGGTVIVLKNQAVAEALVSFAREYGITHVVIGRPGRKKILKFFQPSLHDILIKQLSNVDIVIA
jgi:two-component system sensor histidine kinase KdpD